MRQYFPALLGLLLAVPAGAQTAVRVTAGLTGGSALVSDILDGPISLGTGLTPTLTAAVAHPIGGGYRGLLEARIGRGALKVDDDGTTDDLDNLTTIGVMLLVEGPFAAGLRWEAGAGLLSYRPSARAGVFSQGGPSPWMIGGGLSWSRPIGNTMRFVANGRYDFHQFRTKQLESRGYTQFQTVHRVGVGIGVERSF